MTLSCLLADVRNHNSLLKKALTKLISKVESHFHAAERRVSHLLPLGEIAYGDGERGAASSVVGYSTAS